jgi:hypothetical protein
LILLFFNVVLVFKLGGDMFCDFVLKYFQGTQIQATMFNDAARKFYDKFSMGMVFYISKGTLKVANK